MYVYFYVLYILLFQCLCTKITINTNVYVLTMKLFMNHNASSFLHLIILVFHNE